METVRVLELYSGIGGMHYALKGESWPGRSWQVPSGAAMMFGNCADSLKSQFVTSSPVSHASNGEWEQGACCDHVAFRDVKSTCSRSCLPYMTILWWTGSRRLWTSCLNVSLLPVFVAHEPPAESRFPLKASGEVHQTPSSSVHWQAAKREFILWTRTAGLSKGSIQGFPESRRKGCWVFSVHRTKWCMDGSSELMRFLFFLQRVGFLLRWWLLLTSTPWPTRSTSTTSLTRRSGTSPLRFGLQAYILSIEPQTGHY